MKKTKTYSLQGDMGTIFLQLSVHRIEYSIDFYDDFLWISIYLLLSRSKEIQLCFPKSTVWPYNYSIQNTLFYAKSLGADSYLKTAKHLLIICLW